MNIAKTIQALPLKISSFLILALVITLFCGLVYFSAQQIYRQSANDPQIQISEDMADYLSQGKDVNAIVPKPEVDIAKSLVWFVMFFNDKGEIISSNAKLDGQTPVLPFGVLDHARKNGQNRVTWEPKEGVRIAAVVTSYNGGTVLVGRSLRETENRVHYLGKKVMLAWLITVAAAFAGTWFLLPSHKKSR